MPTNKASQKRGRAANDAKGSEKPTNDTATAASSPTETTEPARRAPYTIAELEKLRETATWQPMAAGKERTERAQAIWADWHASDAYATAVGKDTELGLPEPVKEAVIAAIDDGLGQTVNDLWDATWDAGRNNEAMWKNMRYKMPPQVADSFAQVRDVYLGMHAVMRMHKQAIIDLRKVERLMPGAVKRAETALTKAVTKARDNLKDAKAAAKKVDADDADAVKAANKAVTEAQAAVDAALAAKKKGVA